MKLIFIYTSKDEKFSESILPYVKLQIDNSIECGWKPEDIILVTNFKYEYHNVKSLVIPFITCKYDPNSTKSYVIHYMLNNGLIGDDLYWAHDFDLYQNYPIEELELGNFDLGVCSYEYKSEWNCGSIFFRKSAKDKFNIWYEEMEKWKSRRIEEMALTKLTNEGKIEVKKMNVTYNISMRRPHRSYKKATKPIKCVHFHPYYMDYMLPETLLDTFMYGKNPIGIPFMSERLIKLFHRYGFK